MNDSAAATPVVLETDVPLSQSILWRLQRAYFDETGADAWRRGVVPHHVTSNPFIAAAYAEVVAGYLRDLVVLSRSGTPLDPAAPIYIVELGGGSGRFMFHFLRRLTAIRALCPSLPAVRYVFTDFTQKNVDALSEHPQLRGFFDSGVLDLARFDAGNDHSLVLRSGETLTPGSLKNPLIVIANYVFDGLPMDLLHVDGDTLKEGLVTVSNREPGGDPTSQELISKLDLHFTRRDTTLPFFNDPAMDGVLDAYRTRLSSTAIHFPTASLRALARLAELSSGRLLLLSADKGYHREEALLNRGEPELVLHGSFSLSVNYDAIARWFQGKGGRAWFSSQSQPASLEIGALLLNPSPESFAELAVAFDRSIENVSPNDFHTVKNHVEKHLNPMTIEDMLAFLRLSAYDSRLFGMMLPALLKAAAAATPQQGVELLVSACRVWEGHFAIGESFDLPFEIGRLCYALKFDEEAVEFFETSLRFYGAAQTTYFNIALSHQRQRRHEEALAAVNKSLAADPSYKLARELRIQIESALSTKPRLAREVAR